VDVGVLPFRYRMLGINPADFEISVSDSAWVQSFAYRPKISLVLPCNRGFAFTFYGGVSVNLYDRYMAKEKPVNGVRTDLLGGVSMRLNYVGKFPVDIFAEYKYPLKGIDRSLITRNEQMFRVGINFAIGIDH
jgi:hypothetical protein